LEAAGPLLGFVLDGDESGMNLGPIHPTSGKRISRRFACSVFYEIDGRRRAEEKKPQPFLLWASDPTVLEV
jgi:hypothetical protein